MAWELSDMDAAVAELSANREREAKAQYLANNPESQALEDQTLNLAAMYGLTSVGSNLARAGAKRSVANGLSNRAITTNRGSNGLAFNPNISRQELANATRLRMEQGSRFGQKATAIADVQRPSLLRNIDAKEAAIAHEKMNAAAMYERAKAIDKAKYQQAGQDSLQSIFGAK